MDRDQTIREERDLCICFFIVREFLLEAKGIDLNCSTLRKVGRVEGFFVRY